MKKAKEYADMYNENPSAQMCKTIVVEFLNEVKEIMGKRHTHGNEALFSVLDEQDRKWRAFARLVPDIKPSGFEGMMKLHMADVYLWWRGPGAKERKRLGRRRR